MERLFLGLVFFIVVLSGCDEVPPFIDFSEPGKSKDTTYIVSNIPPAQHKAVLIEDITGVRCVNCPSAALKIKEIIADKTEDSVIAIALYPWPKNTNGLFSLTAPYPGFPQLANDTSSNIVESLDIPTGLPSGYVDRYIFAPQIVRYNAVGNWSNLVNSRLRVTTPVNITMTKTLSGRKVNINIKLQYTQARPGNHKFALYLTEDKIISKQASTTGQIDNYVHNHALRSTLDLPMGRLLNAQLVPGRTFDKYYEYELPLTYVLQNCHLVAVVIDASTNEVINVRKIALQ